MQRRGRQIQPTDLKKKAVGAIVSHLRRRAGYSQEQLGAECGFDRTYISRLERGILNPTVLRLWKIADTLDAPLHRVVTQMEIWVAEQQKARP
jgi:transcriptional regulator with XRE-family HTH domain